MIELIFFVTCVLIITLLFNKSNRKNAILLLSHAGICVIISVFASLSSISADKMMMFLYKIPINLPVSFFLQKYFFIDQLNVLFLIITNILYFGISLYNYQFIDKSEFNYRKNNNYSIGIIIFIFSIIGLILSTHLTLLWVFLELSTLSSTFLIIYEKSRNSLEAGWKYVFICSIGIALAFFGIILLTIGLGQHNSLFFSDLYANAKLINPFWLKLSFIFILIGMGTKMGLAPVHTWLPDAHSEAPSPISALLSGGLLNVAFLGIIRYHKLMKLSGFTDLSSNLLLLMGFFSIIVCAIYVYKVKNYKRMLAYSSIENMGIIAIGTAIGGLALYAALLHMIAHSLSKASFFLCSGNILHKYKTKSINQIHGLFKTDPLNAYLFFASFVAIIGLPPFPIFLSEYLIIKSLLINHTNLAIIFVILLTLVIAGMAKNVFSMLFGEVIQSDNHQKESFLAFLPQILFLSFLLIMGIYLPAIMHKIITYAAFSI